MALDFIAGWLGGCAGVLVGHPFDTVKVRLQTQNGNKPMYKGTYDAFRSIIRQESVFGLFKGMKSPMYGLAFINAIVFGVQGNVQRRMANPDSLPSYFTSGAIAGTAQSFLVSPVELTKTRMQLQGLGKNRKQFKHSERAYKDPMDCLMKIYKAEGVKGVFRGLGLTVAREAPSFGVYFVAYEQICRWLTPKDEAYYELRTSGHLFAGGMAGILSWISTYPIDVIKSRIQADITHRYSGFWHCCVLSYQEEGWKVFARGLGPTLLRAFPVNAATFATVAWTLRLAKQQNFINQTQESCTL